MNDPIQPHASLITKLDRLRLTEGLLKEEIVHCHRYEVVLKTIAILVNSLKCACVPCGGEHQEPRKEQRIIFQEFYDNVCGYD